MAKDKQANNSANPGGRKKGMNKSIIDARKIIRTQGELEYNISKDVVVAYDIIRNVMLDKEAPAATQRAAANDIIKMFEQLQEKSKKIVDEFEEDYQERSGGGSSEDSGSNVRPMFQWADES